MYLSFNTEKSIPYQNGYTSNPFTANVNSNNNLWNGYFTTDNEKSPKMTTAEGIEKLISMKKNTEQAKEAKKIEQEKKKMSKLLQKMQKEKAIEMTKKQSNALNLIKSNPDLAFLYDGIVTKLSAVLAQSNNLLSTVIESLDSDSTSDKLNSINTSVTKAREQLVKDGQKILSGIVKIGAYSEAMLLVEDDKKKDKYRNSAINIAQSLPDVSKKELKLSSSSNYVENIEEPEDENIKTFQDDTADNNKLFALQSNNDEIEKTENISEEDNSKTNNQNDNDSEISDNSNSSKQEIKDENDFETEQVKKEVEEELKKQKSGKKVLIGADNKALKSVLFD